MHLPRAGTLRARHKSGTAILEPPQADPKGERQGRRE
jgi:hypothetical protein